MSIQFWLSGNNGAERLRLPVNPESISVRTAQQFTDINVSQLGEYTVIGDKNPTEFEISSFFPQEYNPSYCEYEDIPNPWQVVGQIETWQKNKMPIRLNVTGSHINYAVTIRSFNYEAEKAGSPGDIYYSMSLKEYRFIEFRKTAVLGVSNISRPNTLEKPTKYTVKNGDTLSSIALKIRAKGVKIDWLSIYKANKSVIGKNPNLILPGQKLVIPN